MHCKTSPTALPPRSALQVLILSTHPEPQELSRSVQESGRLVGHVTDFEVVQDVEAGLVVVAGFVVVVGALVVVGQVVTVEVVHD